MIKLFAVVALLLISNPTFSAEWNVGTLLARHYDYTLSYTCTLVSQIEGTTQWNAECDLGNGSEVIDANDGHFFVAEVADSLAGLKLGDKVSPNDNRIVEFYTVEKLIFYTQRYQSCKKDIHCKEWREIERSAYLANGEWHSAQSFQKMVKPRHTDARLGQVGWLLDEEPCKAVQCKSNADDWHEAKVEGVVLQIYNPEDDEDNDHRSQRTWKYLFKTPWDGHSVESLQSHEVSKFYWKSAEAYVDFKVGGKILSLVEDENYEEQYQWGTITKILANSDYQAVIQIDQRMPFVSPKDFEVFNGRMVPGGFGFTRTNSRLLRARTGDIIRDGKILTPDEAKVQDYVIHRFGAEQTRDDAGSEYYDQRIFILDTQKNIWLGYQCDEVNYSNEKRCEGKGPGSYAEMSLPWGQ